MTGQIDAHNEVVSGERLELEVPVLAATPPAVNEQKGRLAGAGHVEGDLNSI